MPRQSAPIDLTQRIQQLLEQRQHHADALSQINQALESVGAALATVSGHRKGVRGRPPKIESMTPAAGPKKRRRRRHFDMTGEEAILAFVKKNRNPTSREIEEYWQSEGRGGPAANALSKLVKIKMLRREPIPEGRGSKYLLA